MAQQIELALDTFGDIQAGADGKVLTHAQVIRNVIEESCLPMRSAWTASASASITGQILRFPRPRCCSV